MVVLILMIKDFYVEIEGKEILKGVNFEIKGGEFYVVMGLNGIGKFILLVVIMGYFKYEVIKGSIMFDGKDVLEMEVDECVQVGLFFVMQYLSEISGVINVDFFCLVINVCREEGDEIFFMKFICKMDENMEFFEMDFEMVQCYFNEGFLGGEKKCNEIF